MSKFRKKSSVLVEADGAGKGESGRGGGLMYDEAAKLAITKRLTLEGRYKEACEGRDNERRRLRKAGVDRADAVDQSWAWLEEHYPPLPKAEVEAREAAKREPKEPAAVEVEGDIPGLNVFPKAWGELPKRAKWEDEMEWAYQNLQLVLVGAGLKRRVDLKKATSPAPSYGAVACLRMAVSNFNSFMKDLLPKAKRGEVEGEEQEMVRRERKSIEEIRALLEQMREAKE
jgi:hypothetical protein